MVVARLGVGDGKDGVELDARGKEYFACDLKGSKPVFQKEMMKRHTAKGMFKRSAYTHAGTSSPQRQRR